MEGGESAEAKKEGRMLSFPLQIPTYTLSLPLPAVNPGKLFSSPRMNITPRRSQIRDSANVAGRIFNTAALLNSRRHLFQDEST